MLNGLKKIFGGLTFLTVSCFTGDALAEEMDLGIKPKVEIAEKEKDFSQLEKTIWP